MNEHPDFKPTHLHRFNKTVQVLFVSEEHGVVTYRVEGENQYRHRSTEDFYHLYGRIE